MSKQTPKFSILTKLTLLVLLFACCTSKVEGIPYLLDGFQNLKIRMLTEPEPSAESLDTSSCALNRPHSVEQLQINYRAELPSDFGATAVTLVTRFLDNGELGYTIRLSQASKGRVLYKDSKSEFALYQQKYLHYDGVHANLEWDENRFPDYVWAIRLRLVNDTGKFMEGSCVPGDRFDDSEQSVLKASGRIFFDKGEFVSAKATKWQICLIKDYDESRHPIVTCSGEFAGYDSTEQHYPDDSKLHWIDLQECSGD